MNRRRFLKVFGIGGLGLALAPLLGLPKVKNEPKTEEWLKKAPKPVILSDDTLGYRPLPVVEPLLITTPDGEVYFSKMAKRLKEIEGKVFDV